MRVFCFKANALFTNPLNYFPIYSCNISNVFYAYDIVQDPKKI